MFVCCIDEIRDLVCSSGIFEFSNQEVYGVHTFPLVWRGAVWDIEPFDDPAERLLAILKECGIYMFRKYGVLACCVPVLGPFLVHACIGYEHG